MYASASIHFLFSFNGGYITKTSSVIGFKGPVPSLRFSECVEPRPLQRSGSRLLQSQLQLRKEPGDTSSIDTLSSPSLTLIDVYADLVTNTAPGGVKSLYFLL
jgi:hypothetical protein